MKFTQNQLRLIRLMTEFTLAFATVGLTVKDIEDLNDLLSTLKEKGE